MISSSDEVSHKRIISLLSFGMLMGMVAIKALGHQVDRDLIYAFTSLCAGQSLLSVIDKFSNKNEAV